MKISEKSNNLLVFISFIILRSISISMYYYCFVVEVLRSIDFKSSLLVSVITGISSLISPIVLCKDNGRTSKAIIDYVSFHLMIYFLFKTYNISNGDIEVLTYNDILLCRFMSFVIASIRLYYIIANWRDISRYFTLK